MSLRETDLPLKTSNSALPIPRKALHVYPSTYAQEIKRQRLEHRHLRQHSRCEYVDGEVKLTDLALALDHGLDHKEA